MTDAVPTARRDIPTPVTLLRGLAGGVVGGILAYFLVKWLRAQGFYAMMLPGLFVGLGCGYAAGGRSHILGIVAAIVTIASSILTEWHVYYEEPLVRFLTHLYLLPPVKLGMHALGAIFGYWFGMGRDYGWRGHKVMPP